MYSCHFPNSEYQLNPAHSPAAAAESVDEGVAAGAGGAEAADVGVRARLAVLAARQHHHVALARPEKRSGW